MNLLEALLSNTYTADVKGDKMAALGDLKAAIHASADLTASARSRFKELDDLIQARGEGACAYSTKYWGYLKEVLA